MPASYGRSDTARLTWGQFANQNTTVTDLLGRRCSLRHNFAYTTGTGGTALELALGIETSLNDNVNLSSSFSGRYGVQEIDLVGYQGQARLTVAW